MWYLPQINMTNILIVTHGTLANALVQTSELIVGSSSNIYTHSLNLGDDPEEFSNSVGKSIEELSENDNLLIFTDLFGGTPSNSVMTKLFKLNFPNNIANFTGVNLPLLLEAIPMSNYSSDFDELINHLDSILSLTMRNVRP